jgi:two-component system sensor histidine kinase GlrK
MPLHPRSLLQLLLAGFALTILPLAAALITAVVYLDRVTEHGREAVVAAAEYMRASQHLVDQVTSLERFARQYHVLGDRAYLKLYRDRHAEIAQTVASLRAFGEDTASVDDIARFSNQLTALDTAFLQLADGGADVGRVTDGFTKLAEQARVLRTLGQLLISKSTNRLLQSAELADRLLFWQAAALLPAVLLVGAGCVFLVIRPLRQLERAIRALGRGEFSHPITVRGPDDVESLGQTLDWTRQRLEALEEQKSTFLRQVSHELKTPLTSLREGAALLRDGISGPLNDDQHAIVEVLLDNSRRLQRLIENLLDYNKLQMPIRLDAQSVVSLDTLLDEVLDGHLLSLRRRRLTLERQRATVEVRGDPEKLRTVIDNLLSNAIKFSPRGQEIGIAVRREDEVGVLEIRDAGPGIGHDEREAIFEPFVQGRAKAAGHIKGTGLGLAIARRFAHLHHGELRALPNPSGCGACFRLELPVADAGSDT